MALRTIVKEGDPVLSKVCRPVTEFNDRLHTLLDDMTDTLLDSGGIGLAAPQVGVLRRVVVIDLDEDGVLELVNPKIIETDGEQDGMEGCLSAPGKWGMVKRPDVVTVEAQDRDGEWFQITGTELIARCFCHELDHLDGHLYIEKAYHKLTPEEIEEINRAEEDEEQ